MNTHRNARIISLDSIPMMVGDILKDLHQRHGYLVLPEQPHANRGGGYSIRACVAGLLDRIQHLARVVEGDGPHGGLITVVIPNFLYALPIDDLEIQGNPLAHDVLAKFLKRHTRTLLRRHGLEDCWFVRIVLQFDPDECFETLLSDMTSLSIADILGFQDHLLSKALPPATVIDVPRDTRLVGVCLRETSDAIAQTMT